MKRLEKWRGRWERYKNDSKIMKKDPDVGKGKASVSRLRWDAGSCSAVAPPHRMFSACAASLLWNFLLPKPTSPLTKPVGGWQEEVGTSQWRSWFCTAPAPGHPHTRAAHANVAFAFYSQICLWMMKNPNIHQFKCTQSGSMISIFVES